MKSQIYTPRDHALPPSAGRTDPPSVSVDRIGCICAIPALHPTLCPLFLSLYVTAAFGPPPAPALSASEGRKGPQVKRNKCHHF